MCRHHRTTVWVSAIREKWRECAPSLLSNSKLLPSQTSEGSAGTAWKRFLLVTQHGAAIDSLITLMMIMAKPMIVIAVVIAWTCLKIPRTSDEYEIGKYTKGSRVYSLLWIKSMTYAVDGYHLLVINELTANNRTAFLLQLFRRNVNRSIRSFGIHGAGDGRWLS